jgi:hypothetical protein
MADRAHMSRLRTRWRHEHASLLRWAACLLLWLVAVAPSARADTTPGLTSLAPRSTTVSLRGVGGFPPASQRAPGLELHELRLTQRDARRREGLALFVWGAINVVGGAALAGAKHDDRAWLSASITSLGFGAINALLALPLLDLSGARHAAILRERSAPTAMLRERELVAQLKSGQVFALNTGLDVFYLATGAFLLAMSARGTRHADWERGVGAAFLVQGTFLLGFDIACWIGSNRRADALRRLR